MKTDRRKKTLFAAVAVFLFFLLSGLAAEVVLRLVFAHRDMLLIVPDQQLGWRPKENFSYEGKKVDEAGIAYPVRLNTNPDGFRLYGRPEARGKSKILFLGDSYTQATDVSDNKTYYAIVQGSFRDRAEVFAHGGMGYGTLQACMVLEKFKDRIKPDIIVLQASGNDFTNNSFELESNSLINNNNKRRPYMSLDGTIEYKTPKKHFRSLWQVSFQHSRLLYYLLSRADRVLLNARYQREKDDPKRRELESKAFEESVRVTGAILDRMKHADPDARYLAFLVDFDPMPYEAWTQVLLKHGFEYIDGVGRAIHEAEKKGLVVRARDTVHWNNLGNQICADVLIDYFNQREIFPNP